MVNFRHLWWLTPSSWSLRYCDFYPQLCCCGSLWLSLGFYHASMEHLWPNSCAFALCLFLLSHIGCIIRDHSDVWVYLITVFFNSKLVWNTIWSYPCGVGHVPLSHLKGSWSLSLVFGGLRCRFSVCKCIILRDLNTLNLSCRGQNPPATTYDPCRVNITNLWC